MKKLINEKILDWRIKRVEKQDANRVARIRLAIQMKRISDMFINIRLTLSLHMALAQAETELEEMEKELKKEHDEIRNMGIQPLASVQNGQ